MRCAVFGCSNDNQSKNYKEDVMFFRFPHDQSSRLKWKKACGRDKFNLDNSRVCSKHFKDTDYMRDLKYELTGCYVRRRRSLKPEAVPTEYVPGKSADKTVAQATVARDERAEKRMRSKFVEEILRESEKNNSINTKSISDKNNCKNVQEINKFKHVDISTIISNPVNLNIVKISTPNSVSQSCSNTSSCMSIKKSAVLNSSTPINMISDKNNSRNVRLSVQDISKISNLISTPVNLNVSNIRTPATVQQSFSNTSSSTNPSKNVVLNCSTPINITQPVSVNNSCNNVKLVNTNLNGQKPTIIIVNAPNNKQNISNNGIINGNTRQVDKDKFVTLLKQKIAHYESENQAFNKLFSPRQMKRLRNPLVRVHWTEEDLSNAADIYFAGNKAYCLLLQRGFPLPAPSTIRAWSRKRKGKLKAASEGKHSIFSDCFEEVREIEDDDEMEHQDEAGCVIEFEECN